LGTNEARHHLLGRQVEAVRPSVCEGELTG
jgi:hypothetical protein